MGTYEGHVALEYPMALDRTLAGQPCATTGLPTFVMRSAIMTACGVGWWQSRFSASTDVSASIILKVFDPRSGAESGNAWVSGSGYLLRPKFASVRPGGNSLVKTRTIYTDVEITVMEFDTKATIVT